MIPDSAALVALDSAMAPGALMCAWMDIPAADRDEFCEFHDREHLFERLSMPGFRRGRRFAAVDASSDFLIVYEVADLAALTSDVYLARLNSPTPWTLRSLAKVEKTRRATVRVLQSRGRARGGFVLALRCEAYDESSWNDGVASLANHLARRPGVVAFHAGTSDDRTSNLQTAERTGGSRTSTWAHQLAEQILIVEAVSAGVLTNLLRDELSDQGLANHGVRRRTDAGIYGLQVCVEPARLTPDA